MKFRLGAAVAALVLAIASVTAVAVGRNAEGETGLISLLRDPLSLMAMRSPGERDPGALFSSKPRRAEPAPVERVLSTVRERPAPPETPPAPAIELPPLYEVLPPGAGVLPAGALDSEGRPGWHTSWLPPGPSGGGGGVFPQPPPPPPPPPPPSPIPEPDVWAMMILGFFSIGIFLRRAARKGRGVLA